jgi:transcription elongation factor Elf1
METQERLLECLLECPFCGTENPPEVARWNYDQSSYDAICQGCGKKFSKTERLEWSAG